MIKNVNTIEKMLKEGTTIDRLVEEYRKDVADIYGRIKVEKEREKEKIKKEKLISENRRNLVTATLRYISSLEDKELGVTEMNSLTELVDSFLKEYEKEIKCDGEKDIKYIKDDFSFDSFEKLLGVVKSIDERYLI